MKKIILLLYRDIWKHFSINGFWTFPQPIEIKHVKHFIKAKNKSKIADSKALDLSQTNTDVDEEWSCPIIKKNCVTLTNCNWESFFKALVGRAKSLCLKIAKKY